MKRIPKRFIAGILVVFIVSIFSYQIGHKTGYKAGFQRATGLIRGNFVMEISALEDIRNDNLPEVIKSLETYCYSDAVILLESPKWRNDTAAKLFMPHLIKYRKKFAAPQSQWTYTEKLLEQLLTQRKGKK
jgi:hypothetical protein